MRTIAHSYSTYSEATSVVNALEGAGIPHSDISIVSGDKTANTSGTGGTATGMTSGDAAQGASTGAGPGATLGTVLGGGAGLLAGLGSLAIPGVGPIVAAGWLVATLAGAGVSEADANTYAEGVRRGGAVVTVRADEAQAVQIEAALDGRTAVNLETRRAEYQTDGWERFEQASPAYTSEQLTTERGRRVRPL